MKNSLNIHYISKYKKFFSNKIKENFLAKVLHRVEELSNELNLKELFDFKFNIFDLKWLKI